MRFFEITDKFANDMVFLCNAITQDEFYKDGYFYERAMMIYRKYSWSEESGAFDVDLLKNDLIRNADVQSLEGLQNAFDIWKTILNRICIPDYDICTFAELNKDKEHKEEAVAILEMITDLCGEVRRMVVDIMDDYCLENRSNTDYFLSPPYYELGDVGDNATHDKKDQFRAKYESYISNIDDFLNKVDTIQARDLKNFYTKNLSRFSISLKEFVLDVLEITPERIGEKGWNYEAIRKYI